LKTLANPVPIFDWHGLMIPSGFRLTIAPQRLPWSHAVLQPSSAGQGLGGRSALTWSPWPRHTHTRAVPCARGGDMGQDRPKQGPKHLLGPIQGPDPPMLPRPGPGQPLWPFVCLSGAAALTTAQYLSPGWSCGRPARPASCAGPRHRHVCLPGLSAG
jgi:hypothetical protein